MTDEARRERPAGSSGRPGGEMAGASVGAPCDRLRLLSSTLLVVLGVSLALQRYFVCDDAFISFRYARNLARGLGLVYNPGERVEGFTNLLWTLLMVPAFPLGVDVRLWSAVFGYAFFALGLLLLWQVTEDSERAAPPGSRACLSLALAGTVLNHSVLNWASGGLETALAFCLVLAVALLYARAARGDGLRAAAALSLSGALLTLTRPDGLLLAGVFSACLLIVRAAGRSAAVALRQAAAVLLPGGALLVLAFGWRLAYYGSVLPNTYYAKNAGLPNWDQGLLYLGSFFRSYPPLLLALVLPVIAVVRLARARGEDRRSVLADPFVPASLAAAAFLAYVARVGGDFMEYRLLVPVVPLVYLALERLLPARVRRAPGWAAALFAALGLLMLRDVEVIGNTKMETRETMRYHIEVQRWDLMGRGLARVLPRNTLIATTAGGALPFYYEGPVIDLLGLTDGFVSRLPMDLSRDGATIGHCKFAPDSYLRKRGVSFSFPWIQRADSFSGDFPRAPGEVLVRVGADSALRGQYVTATPEMDAWIAAHPADFKAVGSVARRAADFLPPEVLRRGRVVAFLDLPGEPLTRLDRWGNLVTDAGRPVPELALAVPAEAAGSPRLVLRADLRAGAAVQVEVDGRSQGRLASPPVGGGFEYLEIPLSGVAAGARVVLRSSGTPLAAHALWWVVD